MAEVRESTLSWIIAGLGCDGLQLTLTSDLTGIDKVSLQRSVLKKKKTSLRLCDSLKFKNTL